jgi:hypothetical protein
MTRKSRREIETALDDLGSNEADEYDEFDEFDVVVSWRQPDDEEPADDAVVIDFTEVDT